MTTPIKPEKINKKPKKSPSFGTLSFIETRDGDLRMAVDIEQNEGTSEDLMFRIRSTLCGLSYLYNKNGEHVEAMGEAYIEGLETGIESMKKKDTPSGSSGPNEHGATMGFRATHL
jgi:hypothetical protein